MDTPAAHTAHRHHTGHPHPADDPHHPAPSPRRWWVLAVLCLAQFMVVLDVTVVNVALPVMGDELGLGRAASTWVVTAYTLCFGGLMLLGGRLADTRGRRVVFLTGLAVFTAGSLGSGLAGSATALITARAAQGIGAAMLSPAALSILTTTFHGPERNKALGVWAGLGGAGAAVGVLVGGAFTDGPGWEWAFYVNVPVGIALAVAVPLLVDGGIGRSGGRIDVPGALAATAAVAALIYGLVRAGDQGWGDPGTLAAFAAGIVLAAGFVAIERSVAEPLVRLPAHGRRAVLSGNVVMLAATGLLLSFFFLSSQYMQRTLGLGAFDTGLVFLPVAVAIGLGSHLAMHVIAKHGGRPAAIAGFILAGLGALFLARVPDNGSAWANVLPGFLVASLGLGATFVAATTTALAYVAPDDAGVASGLVNTGHEFGATLGIALMSTAAASSLDARAMPMPTGGIGTAFVAAAAAAGTMAVLAGLLLPGGPPPETDRPMFAH
ncbi:DHA2 family efflux MFS transporter permease subunit [Yinghuangia aomiensis]|uniref:DHA2 family efflux MFS transporter permease subunit n=1 Tax=Yinghuangia aomiensis TaxID=676205 RepID=A0ABP9HEH0_9ACTN